jgi:phthalate 4,5-cis-dihydrodiol dehydrogenase
MQAPLRIGLAGFGAAGQAFLPALRKHTGFQLTAIVEPQNALRTLARNQCAVPVYESLTAMLSESDVDAVYLATPTELHTPQVIECAKHCKHVLVEKPMATHLSDAQAMVAATHAAQVVLVVGHSHSFDAPILAMRSVIDGGRLGKVRMVNTWCFTDWIYRPRRPDELNTNMGGGVTFRQGAHQFDILRLLCGGLVNTVKARTFDWDPDRAATGAHTVMLDFANGAAATAVYSGYGGLSSMDLGFPISEWGFEQTAKQRTWARKPQGPVDPQSELQAKQKRAANAIPGSAPFQPFFGLTVVHCEKGDIRQTPTGLRIETAQGTEDLSLPNDLGPRDGVLIEFHDAITGIRPALHNGHWGLATLEVCEAVMASSASGREVSLHHQIPTPPSA